MSALEYLAENRDDGQQAFNCLSDLLYKIECDAMRGMPLQSNHREWSEGNYPAEHDAGRSYIRAKVNKLERLANLAPLLASRNFPNNDSRFDAAHTI